MRKRDKNRAMMTAADPKIFHCGVVDHGLFCGMTTAVLCAGAGGVTVTAPEEKNKAEKIVKNMAFLSAAVGLVAVATMIVRKR